jgi:hypothetical protein
VLPICDARGHLRARDARHCFPYLLFIREGQAMPTGATGPQPTFEAPNFRLVDFPELDIFIIRSILM